MPLQLPGLRMARPKAELPPQAVVRALLDTEGRIAVRVTPGARSESVAVDNDRLAIKVRAKPQDGAANDAVAKLLAQALGIATSRCRMMRGATSRDKLFQVDL